MRPATLICTSQAGNTKRLTGSEIAPGVVAVSPGKHPIWVIGGAVANNRQIVFQSDHQNTMRISMAMRIAKSVQVLRVMQAVSKATLLV